jgi:tetratricopeptide (TPR) repeat protein
MTTARATSATPPAESILMAQALSAAKLPSQPASKSLLDKARAFKAQGRMDLAVQTWQQILLTAPNNPDALSGLARAAKLDGNTALSNSYLERLRTINPNDPNIARTQSLSIQQSQITQLQQAGKLADAGQYAAAMAIYRQIFAGNPPPGDSALAYYSTEAATEAGRPHAIAGLRSLTEKFPEDSRYQIALGRILTFTPKTREEGRRLLAHHSNDPQANQALRQSLLWDSSNPAAAGAIRSYLAGHNDPQLAAALQASEHGKTTSNPPPVAVAVPARPAVAPPTRPVDELSTRPAAQVPARTQVTPAAPAMHRQAPVYTPRTAAKPQFATAARTAGTAQRARSEMEVEAYRALDAKHMAEAETLFMAVLNREPKNSLALSGMGYIRMQQGNFLGALSFLEEAHIQESRIGAAKIPGMDEALDTARFWFFMGEGNAALVSNDLTRAESLYRSAALALHPTCSEDAAAGFAAQLLHTTPTHPAHLPSADKP